MDSVCIAADWIASNPYYFPLIPIDENGSSMDYAKRAFQRLNLTHPWMPEECWDAELLYLERFGFTPNAIQNMVSEAVLTSENPRILILEAQMGAGKTEAALAAAEMIAGKTLRSGVYFGLPHKLLQTVFSEDSKAGYSSSLRWIPIQSDWPMVQRN